MTHLPLKPFFKRGNTHTRPLHFPSESSMMGVALLFTLMLINILSCRGQLQLGFYSQTCPDAESIVRSVVADAILSDPTMPAVLLRLQFHDCFVQGCDGSILIEGAQAERLASGHQGVRGFDVIERAKAQLEQSCPGIVSCADIVVLAARDAVFMANGPSYQVPTGRRDGLVSNVTLADDMPEVSDSILLLKAKFQNKGLTPKDLVLLSAAHTIGTTACFFMTRRLYNFVPGGGSDPSIRPDFLPELTERCPKTGDVNVRLPMDVGSERRFDMHILKNIRDGLAVLESDARLNDDMFTKNVIESYFSDFNPMVAPSFESDFVDSMIKMGQIGVKTGLLGEIRRTCSSFN